MTVRELIAALEPLDGDLPVILEGRYPEFTVTVDAALAPPYADRFERMVFIDPIHPPAPEKG